MAFELNLLIAGLVVAAYALGSFPSGLLMSRLIAGVDVRNHGSGNIGMVNVFRAAGSAAGVATFALDGLKGFGPVLLAIQLGIPDWSVVAVAAATILGHDWSILLRGKGGKGIATSVGTAGAMAPPVALVAIGIWIALLVTFRYASLASLLMIAALPGLLALSGLSWIYVSYGLVLLAMAIYQHRENILRLRTGSELKINLGSRRVRHSD